MRTRMFWAIVLLLALTTGLGQAATLPERIKEKENAIARKKAKEGVLTNDISAFTARINRLQGDIGGLEVRQQALQSDLDVKLVRLSAIQADLRTERARLARLRAKLVSGREALAKRLVELYKADSPDMLTVVMGAKGFAALLESTEFARRIGRQDRRILVAVASAKRQSATAAARLDGLEEDATEVAAAVQTRRDEVAGVKDDLVARRDSYASVREDKRTALASIQGHRHELEGHLKGLQAQEARIRARLAGVPASGVAPRAGSGGLIWPVNGPIVSPFGQRWGRLHAGVDIAVPNGTAVRAPAGGTVQIAGPTSGYGNYVCVQHGGGLSTCSAHNTSIAVSVGQSVSKGQIIASSGCTGHCFGPHVHFETRVNGAPVDPMGYL